MYNSNIGNIIRLHVNEIPILHRNTQGVRLIDLGPDEKVVGLARTERGNDNKDEDPRLTGLWRGAKSLEDI